MKRIILVLFAFITVLVFLRLASGIYEEKNEIQVDLELIEYIIE